MARRVDKVALDAEIKTKLGLDLKKYRNDEVAVDVVDIIVFPVYAITWISIPVLISIVVFVLGYFVLDLTTLDIMAYSTLGLVLMLLSGVFAGLLYFIRKLRKDILSIIDYIMKLMKSTAGDTNQTPWNFSSEQQVKSMKLLFSGITHVVILPVINKVLTKKIPLLGAMVSGFVGRILSSISNRIKFDSASLKSITYDSVTMETDASIKSNMPEDHEQDSSQLNFEKRMSYANKGVSRLVVLTTNMATIPLAILFWICFLILIIFIYIIN